MYFTPWLKHRSFQVILSSLGLVFILFTFLAAGSFQMTNDHPQEGLDPRIVKIMNGTPYRHGEWGLLEVDPSTGHTVNSFGPADRFFEPGSTAKLITVSATLDDLGFDHHLTTPVYGIGSKNQHAFNGNLVLVARGDLTMGGRTKPDGTVDFTSVDHTYANSVPGATLTPQNPLAGINQIAQQINASGITHLNGDVVIDDRLFQPDPNFPVIPDPMIINDNLIDVVLTPGHVGGAPASVTWRPQVAPYHLIEQVTTVAAGQPNTVEVQTFPDGRVLVTGNLPVDAGQIVRVGTILDPSSFARTALIEALERAGVSVNAPSTGPNPTDKLPSNGSYSGDPQVAAYVSPPFREYAKLILKVSHNMGANLNVCLMAVKAGSTNCDDGFPVIAAFLDRVHVDRDQIALADGQGGNPVDRLTPQVVTEMLRYWLGQPEATTFRLMLPILGVDGSLASFCTNCPAKGKVFAKTGTVALPDLLNNRLTLGWALAGYIQVKPGRYYVYDLVVNGSVVQDFNGVLGVATDAANISAILQEDAAA
jgi:D-alanyl-D-alanine carboxypeptidase/D-alanyl-D-alanine-endopeptidase (penicillin-binding protein 4)